MAKRIHSGAPKQKAGESLEKYLKRITGTANQRLRDLEKLANKPKYKNVKKWAYKTAQSDIQRLWGKEKAPWRFGTKIEKNEDGTLNQRDLKAKINAVKRFLDSPTSSRTGIKNVYENRAETINKKYGTGFSWSDIGTFWQSETARKLLEEFDSDTVMKILSELQKLDIDDINTVIKKDKKISDDEVLDDTIKDALKKYNLDEFDFIFK